jgi:serine protease AprX
MHDTTTTHARGIRWRIHAVALLAFAMLAAAAPPPPAARAAAPAPAASAAGAANHVRVVVTGEPGAGRAAAAAVEANGGRVLRRLPIVDGVVARVPAGAIGEIRRAAGVGAVSADRRFQLHEAGASASEGVTLEQVREAAGVAGAGTGAGVDVALVDSGITPVPGLDARDKVVNGPDFSTDAGDDALRHLDAFGHGTHLAGIIAGDGAGLAGVAPDSRLVNVKVADRDGDTSLSRLLAGIDWVVRNRSRDGLEIRVVNLAFGAETDGTYRDDPIAFAVEQAWRHGIVVVAAAGNGGAASTALDSPAVDPYVLAVGAQDMLGTATREDDVVADFSSRGSAERSPDVLAPGVAVISAGGPPRRPVPERARGRERLPRQWHVAVGGRRIRRGGGAARAPSGARS